MAYKKLSEQEKQEILVQLQQETVSISDLANRYGVSQTTIRRLKGADPSPALEVMSDTPAPTEDVSLVESGLTEGGSGNGRRVRRRSVSAAIAEDPAPVDELEPETDLEPVVIPPITAQSWITPGKPTPILTQKADLSAASDDGDELDDEDDDSDDLEDLDDLDDDDEDFDEGDLGADIAAESAFSVHVQADGTVSILPLAEATWPRMCYLVVDRSAELITRPLQEFGDLGQIPAAEELARTLPVFENHRVAKRFANPRTQRVIKLPDAKVLQKASPHLQAKGITRLLINGQVYSL